MKRLKLLLLHVLPHHLLSRAVYHLTRWRLPPLKNLMIRLFVRLYGVDLGEAQRERPEDYPDFNSFFTRALKPGVRPLARSYEGSDETIACPVDGAVSQCGFLQAGRLLQAKGLDYTLEALLGSGLDFGKTAAGNAGSASLTDRDWQDVLARHGCFATLYLSPRDYHRIHMPLRGTLRLLRYIPGRLYSVDAYTTTHLPGLFTRNERVVVVFDTAAGPLVMVLVGAIFVGCMATVWEGELRPAPGGRPWYRDYTDRQPPIVLEKGAEMGRFNMGSTVIVLLDGRRAALAPDLAPSRPVRMGEMLGKIRGSEAPEYSSTPLPS